MPLFKCSNCGCCENTALSNYWIDTMSRERKPALCSECDPRIGKWHGKFEKQPFTDDLLPHTPEQIFGKEAR
jgi:hypothetical protein